MRDTAIKHLRRALNSQYADFRDGQWEAISSIVTNSSRLLVVQRTGWGKSMLYFLATKLLRDRGKGLTLLISPLLSLMRNQLIAAERLGLRARTINSSNQDDWADVHAKVCDNQIDLLMISPERLSNEAFRSDILPFISPNVGLLVVDEAHCISDWGHDFRPDYKRIVRLLQRLPMNVPVLAVTATANDRVVNDVAEQIGQPIVMRGSLARESLRLQNISLPDQAQRLAWLADVLPTLAGSGIVYTLTVRDAELVAAWLKTHKMNARAYHSKLEGAERVRLEDMLLANDVKALVATTALGMGFDKPDLGFVVHFQRPASAIHYYQQVGRAGRGIEAAYGVLLSGQEDDEIAEYFQRTALPASEHVAQTLAALERFDEGASLTTLERELNLSHSQIEKVLKSLSLESPAPIAKIDKVWRRTHTAYAPNDERAQELLALRKYEQARMQEYVGCTTCLMNFLQTELDDATDGVCGICANCQPELSLPAQPMKETIQDALRFLRQADEQIEPRKKWASDALDLRGWKGTIAEELRAEEGRTLCRWGDSGWGSLVRDGKTHTQSYDDQLVAACRELIEERWLPRPPLKWVTCIPSLRHPKLVPDFARRLADSLELPFVQCIRKERESQAQKDMQNSYQQASNLAGVFAIDSEQVLESSVLLVDDMVDSGWTFTVATALLREAGSGPVYPFALAKVLNS